MVVLAKKHTWQIKKKNYMMHIHGESLGSAPFKNLTEDDPPAPMPVHFFPAGFIV